MRSRNIFFILVVVVFLVAGFFLIKNNSSKNVEVNQIHFVKIAGKILKVDLALTSEEQERGLSGRNELKEDEGMLFVFDYIKKNAQPESYPEPFLPKQDAKYVLEVWASFSEKNNLRVGDEVEFLSP